MKMSTSIVLCRCSFRDTTHDLVLAEADDAAWMNFDSPSSGSIRDAPSAFSGQVTYEVAAHQHQLGSRSHTAQAAPSVHVSLPLPLMLPRCGVGAE